MNRLEAAQARIKGDEASKVGEARKAFQAERSALVLSQDMDRAKLRAAWRQRSKDRAEAWEKFAALDAKRRKAREGFAGAASPGGGEAESGYRASLLARHARLAMGGVANNKNRKGEIDR